MLIRAAYSLITLLLATLVAGCSVSKDRFRLEGEFKHLHKADIYIYSDEGHDTIHIEGGEFVYEKKLSHPKILTIRYPNFAEMKIVAEPGKTAKFEADASDLSQTKLKGTEENKLLSDFYSEANALKGAKLNQAAETFVTAHPTTLAAEAVFRTYFAEAANIDPQPTQRLLNLLLKNQPHNAALSNLAGKLLPYLQATPGHAMPAFKTVTITGDSISNSDFKGRPLLIFFWATWQYESFQQVRGLKNVVRPYGKRLGVICVNMDYNYRSFINAVHRDSIPGYNVCERKAWASQLVRKLGITSVPANVIVSPEGKIIARDLEYSDMRRRISSIMEQN